MTRSVRGGAKRSVLMVAASLAVLGLVSCADSGQKGATALSGSSSDRLDARVEEYFEAFFAGDLRKRYEMRIPSHTRNVSFPLFLEDSGLTEDDEGRVMREAQLIDVERVMCEYYEPLQATRCVLTVEFSMLDDSGEPQTVKTGQAWDEVGGEWYLVMNLP